MDKYPRSSAMCTAMDNFWEHQRTMYHNFRNGEEFSWSELYAFVNKELYMNHRAWVSPSDGKFLYVTFDLEQDKTAFMLKWTHR
jgi:hypothetical protein